MSSLLLHSLFISALLISYLNADKYASRSRTTSSRNRSACRSSYLGSNSSWICSHRIPSPWRLRQDGCRAFSIVNACCDTILIFLLFPCIQIRILGGVSLFSLPHVIPTRNYFGGADAHGGSHVFPPAISTSFFGYYY